MFRISCFGFRISLPLLLLLGCTQQAHVRPAYTYEGRLVRADGSAAAWEIVFARATPTTEAATREADQTVFHHAADDGTFAGAFGRRRVHRSWLFGFIPLARPRPEPRLNVVFVHVLRTGGAWLEIPALVRDTRVLEEHATRHLDLGDVRIPEPIGTRPAEHAP